MFTNYFPKPACHYVTSNIPHHFHIPLEKLKKFEKSAKVVSYCTTRNFNGKNVKIVSNKFSQLNFVTD